MDELATARTTAKNRVSEFAEEQARLGLYGAARLDRRKNMQCDFEYESQGVKVVCPFSALPGGRRCPGHVPEIRNGQAQATHEHQWEHKQPLMGGKATGELRAAIAERATIGTMQGLNAFLPKQRTFTREEVLTVLRVKETEAAGHPPTDAAYRSGLLHAIAGLRNIFERME